MKNYLKTAIVLTLICAVAAILLAVVNSVTAPEIEKYEQSVVLNALNEVSCGYEVNDCTLVNDISGISGYYPLNDLGKTVGYIVDIKAIGYGGEMSLLASFDVNGTVMACKLVSGSETPGVGKKAENPDYMNKFIGTGTQVKPLPTSKKMLSEEDSAAVSGASITFTAISKSLYNASEFVKSLGGNL